MIVHLKIFRQYYCWEHSPLPAGTITHPEAGTSSGMDAGHRRQWGFVPEVVAILILHSFMSRIDIAKPPPIAP